MKKIISILVLLVSVLVLAACKKEPSAVVTLDYVTKDSLEFSIEIKNTDDVVSGSGMARLYENYGETNQKQAGYKAINKYKDVVSFSKLNPETTYTLEVKVTYDDQSFVVFNGEFTTSNEGSESEPYIINTKEDFMNIQNDISKTAYYRLGQDIDFSGYDEFTSQCKTSSTPFKGTLDGNGYKLMNISFSTSDNYVGIIGYNLGVIKNLKIEGLEITTSSSNSKYYGGALVGYNSGLIENCSITDLEITATFTSGSSSESYYPNLGGLVGYNDQANSSCELDEGSGFINNSNVVGTINVTSTSGLIYGGLIGKTADSSLHNYEINKCFIDIEANVTSLKYGASIGGLIGNNKTILASIDNSYAAGTINVVGNNTNSYDILIGGLLGFSAPITINNTYADEAISLNTEAKCNIYAAGFIAKGAPNAADRIKAYNVFAMGIVSVNDTEVNNTTAKNVYMDEFIASATFNDGTLTVDGNKTTIGRVELINVFSNSISSFNNEAKSSDIMVVDRNFTLDEAFITALQFDMTIWNFADSKLVLK